MKKFFKDSDKWEDRLWAERILPRYIYIVVVQSLSCVWLFVTPWTAASQASLSSTISWSWLKFMFIVFVSRSNHLILCGPLLLLPSVFPSIKVFSNESTLWIRWPNYWSFSISASDEYPGLISSRIDLFYFFVVQGTLEMYFKDHFFLKIV